jgi:GTP-binding protein HflX
MLISDTIGFLKNLPHDLIASFQATLAEVLEADILIHIVDATDEDFESKISTVDNVLEEINAHKTSRILVFNKTDRLFDEEKARCKRTYPHAVFVSAKENTGLATLKDRLKDFFFGNP